MRVLSTICLLAALFAACAPSFAQGVSSPKAEAILRETLDVLGGDALKNVRLVEEKGRAYSFRREQLAGLAVIRIVTKYPDPEKAPQGAPAIMERQYLGKDEEISTMVLYDRAFEITYRGYTPLEEDVTDRMRESRLHNFLYIARQRLGREEYLVEYIGTSIIRNQPAVGIRLVDPDFRVTELWIHRSTKFPIRQEFTRRDPKTNLPIEEVTEWDKFRDVGAGVQWPFYIMRETRGEKTFELFSSEVAVNPPLPDSVFELPSPAKKVSEK